MRFSPRPLLRCVSHVLHGGVEGRGGVGETLNGIVSLLHHVEVRSNWVRQSYLTAISAGVWDKASCSLVDLLAS